VLGYNAIDDIGFVLMLVVRLVKSNGTYWKSGPTERLIGLAFIGFPHCNLPSFYRGVR
jgi:hypothetical protein